MTEFFTHYMRQCPENDQCNGLIERVAFNYTHGDDFFAKAWLFRDSRPSACQQLESTGRVLPLLD